MRTIVGLLGAVLVLLGGLLPGTGHACGPDSDCTIGDRTYRIDRPAGTDPVGAIVYLHGYRGSARAAMRNRALRALAAELGVALVAAKSYAEDWRIPGVPRNRDTDGRLEYDYFVALVTDLGMRHGIDTGQLLLSGFSAGGMAVWSVACHRGHLFRAYAPIAGTFWAPVPAECPSAPVDLLHTHGLSDRIVPLEGRAIADTRQGHVMAALDLFATGGGFGPPGPVAADGLSCARRTNSGDRLLEFCTHDGGHSFETRFIRRAWDVLMTR